MHMVARTRSQCLTLMPMFAIAPTIQTGDLAAVEIGGSYNFAVWQNHQGTPTQYNVTDFYANSGTYDGQGAADRLRGCGALARGGLHALEALRCHGTVGALHKRFPSPYYIQV